MIFQVVHPVVMTIDGESFKDAVKNFAKLNYDLNLSSIIITDQLNHYRQANLKYYSDDNKQKVGISLIPTVWPLAGALAVDNASGQILSPSNMWPFSPTISYDTKEYPATTFLEAPFVPRIVSVGTSSLLSPLVTPLPSLVPPFLNTGVVAGISPLTVLGTKITY